MPYSGSETSWRDLVVGSLVDERQPRLIRTLGAWLKQLVSPDG
jgi:hypothetical protein